MLHRDVPEGGGVQAVPGHADDGPAVVVAAVAGGPQRGGALPPGGVVVMYSVI